MNKKLEYLTKETITMPVIINEELVGHYIVNMNPDGNNNSITNIKPIVENKNTKTQITPEYSTSLRTVFAIYNNECICKNVKTDTEHRIYLRDNYGVSLEYPKLIRGYMRPGEVILYKTAYDILSKGENYAYDYDGDPDNFIFPGTWTDENKTLISLIVNKNRELFGHRHVVVYLTDKGKLTQLYSVVGGLQL